MCFLQQLETFFITRTSIEINTKFIQLEYSLNRATPLEEMQIFPLPRPDHWSDLFYKPAISLYTRKSLGESQPQHLKYL